MIEFRNYIKIIGYIKAGKEIGTKGFYIMPTIFADVQVQLITCFGCHSLFSI